MFRQVSRRPRTLLTLMALLPLFALVPVLPASGAADEPPYVTLEGRAVLPADTFTSGPPSGFAITGDTNGRRVPFPNQSVQGFSAVLPKWNGNYLVLTDNGFGAKANSPDFRLRWYEVDPDFASGSVTVAGYTELYDPSRLVPFRIVNEDLDRVLTGSDFDVESFRQAPDGSFWYGDEFGPYLLHTDATGKLLDPPFATPVPAALAPFARGRQYIQAPENPAFLNLSPDEVRRTANLPSSRGFEGMALNTSATRLYPLLEGPLFDDPVRNRLLIQEFDLATRQYTGRIWFYPLADPGYAIGDMTAINDNEFLVIERDNGQGPTAKFKRIYKVDLREAGPNGVLTKELIVDLMAITDVRGITRPEEGALGLGRIFTFPFVTIEAVYPLDARTLLVLNDNNYPFSSGRRPGRAPDDNEFVLLQLPRRLDVPANRCGSRSNCSYQ